MKISFQNNLISNVSELTSQMYAHFTTDNIVKNINTAQITTYTTYLKSELLVPILTDKENRTIIDAMFQNNLNVTLAAQTTFMHRNTLMYRLDKIKAKIGLDVRSFDDACIIKNMILIYEKYVNRV